MSGGAGRDAPRARVVLVAGLARDGTIGKDGGIPWRYPEDMRAFRAATTGTVLLMGRRTLDSIGRLLPGRETVVLSRDPEGVRARWPGAHAAASLDEALALAARLAAALPGEPVVSVLGGGEVYALALPRADELLLTYVPEAGGGDVAFPAWDPREFEEVARETLERVERVRYRRRASAGHSSL